MSCFQKKNPKDKKTTQNPQKETNEQNQIKPKTSNQA